MKLYLTLQFIAIIWAFIRYLKYVKDSLPISPLFMMVEYEQRNYGIDVDVDGQTYKGAFGTAGYYIQRRICNEGRYRE